MLRFAATIVCDGWSGCGRSAAVVASVDVRDGGLEINSIPTEIDLHPFRFNVPDGWKLDRGGLTCPDCIARVKRESDEREKAWRLEQRRKGRKKAERR